jgi:hypothetical protein
MVYSIHSQAVEQADPSQFSDFQRRRLVHIGLTILGSLRAIPLERLRITGVDLPVYEDRDLTQMRLGCHAVAIRHYQPDGNTVHQAYMTKRHDYRPGTSVSWAWTDPPEAAAATGWVGSAPAPGANVAVGVVLLSPMSGDVRRRMRRLNASFRRPRCAPRTDSLL